MVGADDQAAPCPRDRVLRDHPLSRLDVAEDEIFLRSMLERVSRRLQARQHGIGRRLDVHGKDLVRLDERQGPLRILLVGLQSIGQAHRDEPGGCSLGASFCDGELA